MKAYKACSKLNRSDGIQPPGGWPLMSCRLIAAARPGKGLGQKDREIRTKSEPGTTPQNRLPCIGTGKPIEAEVAFPP